ncbi:hypothetical protein [Halorarius litoreus]|uniref:hypothetical protein n=1 Tax=Halorarius litoreus TaxID=2962676 RepID=UPI0020CD0C51|nr:hypothetical protein [Halorarius litoreus]
MTRRPTTSVALSTLLILSTFVGVVALPMATGAVDARTTAHDPAANYTFSPDNHAPGVENGAAEHYAVGLEKDLTALHTVVVKSEAFNFADCSAAKTDAFGIDRGNDDPGTQTDESLLNKYKGISFQDDKIVVEFYKEEGAVTGETVGLATDDQIVAAGRNCYDNPDQKGWYQVTGKLNGSTNDNTQTDYEISVKTHYIYVCDCDSRQEAVEKLGPPPSEQGDDGGSSDGGADDGSGDGSDGGASEPTATATPESGSDDPTATATATPGGGDDSTTTSSPTDDDTESTTTATGTSDGDSTTTSTATSGPGTADTSATATDDSKADVSTPTENNGPGFGLAAAFGALLASGALALRRRD